MNINEFEKLVLDAVAKVRAQGIAISSGTYGNWSLEAESAAITWRDNDRLSVRHCCALGAVALAMPFAELCEVMDGKKKVADSGSVVNVIVSHYGITVLERCAFVEGFDLEGRHNTMGAADPWYDLGKKIRDQLGDAVNYGN